jgi:uncharacterized protein (DUF58 family)
MGGGIEFADYREYLPGDDVRQIDWSVYLRLRRLLVKLCAEEKELTLVVLLDASRSMDYGEPNKLEVAKRTACILAGIALRNGNRAGIGVLGPSLLEPLRPERSKVSLTGVARALASVLPTDRSAPAACVRQFAARYGRKCVAVLISDLLFDEWPQVLAGLGASGSETHVVQILAPSELDPPERGETTLVDMEDGSEAPLHIDAALLGRYADGLGAFLAGVREDCARKGLGHSLVRSDLPLSRVFLEDFRKEGLVC